MEIIANTKGGYLVQASRSEIEEILNAVTGAKPEKILIGQKIPAIDYATTITKIKTLRRDYCFTELLSQIDRFNKTASELTNAVEKASEIEI
jgi:hypothetical protein